MGAFGSAALSALRVASACVTRRAPVSSHLMRALAAQARLLPTLASGKLIARS